MVHLEGKSRRKAIFEWKESRPNPAIIQSYLGGLRYPAGKEEIISYAMMNGATMEIIDILNKINDMSYNSPAQLNDELGVIM